MNRIRLIHWNETEAAEFGDRLRSAGFAVNHAVPASSSVANLAGENSDAIVIGISRLPAHGRHIGMILRQRKATRHIPIVFAGGKPEKVELARQVFPDAAFAGWADLERELQSALAHPPENPVVPVSRSGSYSGTPLVKKLGIKAGSFVALVDAPEDFVSTLGTLPKDASVGALKKMQCDLVIWFVTTRDRLEKGIQKISGEMRRDSSLWIAWPKKASGVATDVSQADVRRIALTEGLVDYKVCAIDAVWSGLLFTYPRKPKQFS